MNIGRIRICGHDCSWRKRGTLLLFASLDFDLEITFPEIQNVFVLEVQQKLTTFGGTEEIYMSIICAVIKK